jgi:putative transposase
MVWIASQKSVWQKNGRPAAKREAVAHLRERLQMSERRACAVIAADRKMIRYQSRRPPERELRARRRHQGEL